MMVNLRREPDEETGEGGSEIDKNFTTAPSEVDGAHHVASICSSDVEQFKRTFDRCRILAQQALVQSQELQQQQQMLQVHLHPALTMPFASMDWLSHVRLQPLAQPSFWGPVPPTSAHVNALHSNFINAQHTSLGLSVDAMPMHGAANVTAETTTKSTQQAEFRAYGFN